MSTFALSRSPFADQALPTFADLLERLKEDQELLKTTRQNWMWALRTVSRATAKQPAEIIAHPGFVRDIMHRAAPKSIGLSRASWNNARSLLGKILEWAGLTKMPARYMAPFAPAWAALRQYLSADNRRQLDRLFHYCSAMRISPDELSDEVLGVFYDALVSESIIKDPYILYRRATKAWNDAVDRNPGWPQRRLERRRKGVPMVDEDLQPR